MHTRCKDVCPTLRYALPEPSHYRVLGVGAALSWLIRKPPSIVLIAAWELRMLRTFLPHVPVIMHGASTVDEKASCSPDAAGDFDGSDILESALLDDTQGAYRRALAVGGRDQGAACSSLRHLPHRVLRAVAVRSRGETATRSVEV